MTNDDDLKKKQEEFINSCPPLEEMLDSVRDIEGFPIGKDEDILALSDAPWYTACPNPYINKFIEIFGTPYDEATDDYERKPFVSDVSEGKNDPIYMAHTYHTKVPHKAIMPFIEHYTNEGDIVFDGFCGTGMTGVAAQALKRKAVLSDLSPVATFIAHNYNSPINSNLFKKEADRILKDVENECGWMYETLHTDAKTKGTINYTVWSDIFICPYCSQEHVFWEAAVDKNNGKVSSDYSCPHCSASIDKRSCTRSIVNYFDSLINQHINQTKSVPVLINYTVDSKRYDKVPDEHDLNLIKTIEESSIPYWFPTNKIQKGDKTWDPIRLGITHIHHFYKKRNLWILVATYNHCKTSALRLWFNSQLVNLSIQNRYRPGVSFPYNPLSGTIYIPSQISEPNVFVAYKNKLKKLIKAFEEIEGSSLVGVSSAENSGVPASSIDYIFTDPPFGSNLMYSELNLIWESWLKVFTNNQSEAIINSSQEKTLQEYKELMYNCFKEMYRILKPNRWITVEFHNSKPSVWNAIQDSLSKAGFVVAQVAILDKKQGSFNQVTAPGAVKNDLVINAYKPKQQFEERFLKTAGEGLERDFIEQHLDHLPVEPNIERSEQMLFSKMLAHYVQHGYEIKLNAKQFYNLLRDSFKMMDGFWFTDSQVREYDEWKKEHGLKAIEEISKGQQTLFVNDERSALIWLYNFLNDAKTYSDILTAYNQVVTSIDDDIPELQAILQTNFVFENGAYRRPLTEKEKAAKEEQSEKELLKAFDRILNEAKTNKKKIKMVRKEAIKLGFTKAYQEKRFHDIVAVADRLDKKILENNSEITDFVDIARMKMGEDF